MSIHKTTVAFPFIDLNELEICLSRFNKATKHEPQFIKLSVNKARLHRLIWGDAIRVSKDFANINSGSFGSIANIQLYIDQNIGDDYLQIGCESTNEILAVYFSNISLGVSLAILYGRLSIAKNEINKLENNCRVLSYIITKNYEQRVR